MDKKTRKLDWIVKNPVVRSLVNEKPIEIDRITSNRKPNIMRNENKPFNKRNKRQMATPQIYNYLNLVKTK